MPTGTDQPEHPEGFITQGDVHEKGQYHLKGDVIERRSESVYHVEHGEFTACDERDWFIKADEMDIDMERYATGSGVSFNMAGIPVFYTPYFLFPVRRQSGFLIPEAGYSSSEGFFTDNAFFWAISDYQDLTIYSDYRTRIGHGTALEYRYNNSRESRGQVYTKLWDQYNTAESRWDFRFKHGEVFARTSQPGRTSTSSAMNATITISRGSWKCGQSRMSIRTPFTWSGGTLRHCTSWASTRPISPGRMKRRYRSCPSSGTRSLKNQSPVPFI
jgi:hypothetical protein